MRTTVFVQQESEDELFNVGFQLSSANWRYSPPGIIRIARIENSFNIINNNGNYGDIYMKQFVKKIRSFIRLLLINRLFFNNKHSLKELWVYNERKKNIIDSKIILKNKLNNDIINVIIQFL